MAPRPHRYPTIARRAALLLLGASSGLARAGDGMEPIDHAAKMAETGWWMEDTHLVLVVKKVPYNKEYPFLPYPPMVTYDDVIGTTHVSRDVMVVEEALLGSVERSRLEFWGAYYGVPTTEHGIAFVSLWNLETAGFDLPGYTPEVQFYASDAVHSFSPERVLHFWDGHVTDARRDAVCLHDTGWFRPCGDQELPPSIDAVIAHLRMKLAPYEGVSIEGYDP